MTEMTEMNDEQFPIHCKCPIDLTIMKDPVIIQSGITYEREAILRWFNVVKNNPKCPITKMPVDPSILIPNIAVKNQIEILREEQKQPTEPINTELINTDDFDKEFLLPHQIKHTRHLIDILTRKQIAVDVSDTGTGKTYSALSVCKNMNLQPVVICPKALIINWIRVAKIFDVKLMVSNYEMMKSCKYFDGSYEDYEDTKEDCPYFTPQYKWDSLKKKDVFEKYIYNEHLVPKHTVFIFDEAHRCKNRDTINSKLLVSLRGTSRKILLLSATLSDKVETFVVFGYMLDLFSSPNLKTYNSWLLTQKKKIHEECEKLFKEQNKKMTRKSKVKYNHDEEGNYINSIYIINQNLLPYYGSRMSITELGELFPQNTVTADSYYMPNYNEVQKEYDEINYLLKKIKIREFEINIILGKLVLMKVRIELLKVPLYIQLIEQSLEENYSVVMFVNYIETMSKIKSHFEKTMSVSTIEGGQTAQFRQENIEDFQSNKTRLILCSITAGGVGISLHDIHGGHPRKSLISPTWSGQDLVQVLGRIYRAGSKTPAIQKIIYCAKTFEEKIAKIIQKKLKTISGINDGDISRLDIQELIMNDNDETAEYEILTGEEYIHLKRTYIY